MSNDPKPGPSPAEVWHSYMTTGKAPVGVDLPWFESPLMRKVARRLPADPRCQICYYPFSGLGGKLVRSVLHLEPSKMNPHLCNVCERFADSFPGGAELEMSLLFADIRGSTPMAAAMSAYEFGQIIDRFYQVTTNIIYEHGGLVEKLVGDEIAAFFPPAFVDGNNHARAAITAGQAILAATGHGTGREPWVPVGVGIHTGRAYVGALGEPGKNVNIAVLGDNVNIAARLTAQAGQGTMVVSNTSLQASGLSQEGFAFHSLSLKGKDAPMDTWVYQAL